MTTRLMQAPEFSSSDKQKIRVLKDRTRMYYRNSVLHRDPLEGPAVERFKGTGECYVGGIKQEAVWFNSTFVANPKEDVAILAETAQIPMAATSQLQLPAKRKKDKFDVLASRLRGDGMKALHDLYTKLTVDGAACVN